MAGDADFAPTEEDCVRANRDLYRRYLRLRIPMIIGVCSLTYYLLVCLSAGGVAPWPSLATGVVLGMVFVPIAYVACEITVSRSARRLFRQQRTLHIEFHYRWSDETLAYTSVNGEGRVAWGDLHRWHEGRSAFLFLLNARLFYFIPYRILPPSKAEDLRATATAFGPPRL